jgi:hypothetical protein
VETVKAAQKEERRLNNVVAFLRTRVRGHAAGSTTVDADAAVAAAEARAAAVAREAGEFSQRMVDKHSRALEAAEESARIAEARGRRIRALEARVAELEAAAADERRVREAERRRDEEAAAIERELFGAPTPPGTPAPPAEEARASPARASPAAGEIPSARARALDVDDEDFVPPPPPEPPTPEKRASSSPGRERPTTDARCVDTGEEETKGACAVAREGGKARERPEKQGGLFGSRDEATGVVGRGSAPKKTS